MNHRLIKLSAVLFFLLTPIFTQTLTINEFHAKPLGSGQIEFVELIHLGTTPINISNWEIADATSSKTLPSATILPGEFVVLASDFTLFPPAPSGTHYLIPSGGLPSLNNSGDKIELSNSSGIVIDFLIYDDTWDKVKTVVLAKRL